MNPAQMAAHPAGHRYAPVSRPENCGRIALVLQGGGALGAYQAGVYQALHEAGLDRNGFPASASAPSTPR